MAHKKIRVATIGPSSYFFKTPPQQFHDDIFPDFAPAMTQMPKVLDTNNSPG